MTAVGQRERSGARRLGPDAPANRTTEETRPAIATAPASFPKTNTVEAAYDTWIAAADNDCEDADDNTPDNAHDNPDDNAPDNGPDNLHDNAHDNAPANAYDNAPANESNIPPEVEEEFWEDGVGEREFKEAMWAVGFEEG